MPRGGIVVWPPAAAVPDYRGAPPGRPGGPGEVTVSVDPADLLDLGAGLVPARELIAALSGGRR